MRQRSINPSRPASRRLVRPLLTMLVLLGMIGATPAANAASTSSASVEQAICGNDGAMVVRLYRAYFDRLPDQDGLEYWSQILLDSSIHAVAEHMAVSSEYQTRWNGSTDAEYIEGLLYENLLSRPADEGGIDYWKGLLSEVGRSQQVLFWIQTEEMVVKHPVSEPSICHGEGYNFRSIPGGEAVDIDYAKIDLVASNSRCSIASINANWLWLSGSLNGRPIGFAAVDGAQVAGSYTRRDRGIFGERYRPAGAQIEERIEGPTSQVLTSAVYQKGNVWLEHLDGWATDNERSEYGKPIPEEDATQNWRWAIGGITMVIGGQRWQGLDRIGANDYTHMTHRHPFVAFKAPNTLTFGATTSMTSIQLTDWLIADGYTEVMKLDGGASAEFNKFGQSVVAGTPRNIPVWLGIGC